jgi:hypothetical protein
MKPYTILHIVAATFISLTCFSQTSINNESFKYVFKTTQIGARVSYVGNAHSFTFDVKDKALKTLSAEGSDENMHFISIDKSTFQTSIIPMPQPIPVGFNLSNLTIAQQKDAIEGYVDYELDYFKQLGVIPIKLRKEWVYINKKLFMLWEFDVNIDPRTVSGEVIKGQVYLATACFNQMWVTNLPLMNTKDHEKAKSKLKEIAATLKNYNTRLLVK